VRGIFDGGFLSNEVAQRYGWVTPFRSDAIAREEERPRQQWMEYVNTFLSLVHGPGAEARFADEVHKFGILRKPWRLEPELHTLILQLAEVLLNIERRQQREEPLDYTPEEAENSCFLLYLPTVMDDLLKSASMAGLFDSAEAYLSAMESPKNKEIKNPAKRCRKGKKKQVKKKQVRSF